MSERLLEPFFAFVYCRKCGQASGGREYHVYCEPDSADDCSHMLGMWLPAFEDVAARWFEFTFCPLCGVRLADTREGPDSE